MDRTLKSMAVQSLDFTDPNSYMWGKTRRDYPEDRKHRRVIARRILEGGPRMKSFDQISLRTGIPLATLSDLSRGSRVRIIKKDQLTALALVLGYKSLDEFAEQGKEKPQTGMLIGQKVGELLRKARMSGGLTIQEVSNRTGLGLTTISQLETGDRSLRLNFEMLLAISRAVGYTRMSILICEAEQQVYGTTRAAIRKDREKTRRTAEV